MADPIDVPGKTAAGRPIGLGFVIALAFAITLGPGIGVAAITHALGVPLGPALLLGLLAVFVGMGCYPRLLRWIGGDER